MAHPEFATTEDTLAVPRLRSRTLNTSWQCAARGCRATARIGCAILLFGGALLLLDGCSSRSDGSAAAEASGSVTAPMAFSVNDVRATHHLATSTMEGREAAVGNEFVVLDVSVMNPDAKPQVLLEGTLIAMGESGAQTFDTPVTLLSNDYLGMQVLAPRQGVRGKIAYEVPEHLQGVLYWSPGSGRERILLHVNAPPESQRTLADAGPADALQPPIASAPRADRQRQASRATLALAESPRTVAPSLPTPARAVGLPTPSIAAPLVAAATVPPASAGVPLGTVAAPAPAATVAAPMSSAISPLDAWVAAHGAALRSVPTGVTARAEHAPACVAPSGASRLVCEDAVLSAMDIRLDQSVQRAGHYVNPTALQREQEEWSRRIRNACDTTGCLQQAYRSRQARIDALIPPDR